MWLFEAHYTNIFTEEKSKEKIEIDTPCYGAEKEAYLQAMGMAYDRKKRKSIVLILLNLLHVGRRNDASRETF